MGEQKTDEGFSLVEVVVAMFLLGLIAVAILPALWQGVRFSSQQSSTATATRYANSIIDDARRIANCTYVNSIPTLPAVSDGRGVSMTTSTSVVACTPGVANKIVVNVVGESRTLATATALVYIP